MGKDVIIACDFDSAEKTFAFLDRFTGRKPFVKIGMELYYAEGPSIVKEIKKKVDSRGAPDTDTHSHSIHLCHACRV